MCKLRSSSTKHCCVPRLGKKVSFLCKSRNTHLPTLRHLRLFPGHLGKVQRIWENRDAFLCFFRIFHKKNKYQQACHPTNHLVPDISRLVSPHLRLSISPKDRSNPQGSPGSFLGFAQETLQKMDTKRPFSKAKSKKNIQTNANKTTGRFLSPAFQAQHSRVHPTHRRRALGRYCCGDHAAPEAASALLARKVCVVQKAVG